MTRTGKKLPYGGKSKAKMPSGVKKPAKKGGKK